MNVFDAAVEAVRQGGRRRGANMAVLDVYHPDIEDFIRAKQEPGRFRNFNLSVAVDDAFMKAAAEKRPIMLVNPRTRQAAGTRQASELLELVAQYAWQTGDPGLIFVDRINPITPRRPLAASPRPTHAGKCRSFRTKPASSARLIWPRSARAARSTGSGLIS
jgi:ribonucleoside-diphosphate reductase alpha chain